MSRSNSSSSASIASSETMHGYSKLSRLSTKLKTDSVNGIDFRETPSVRKRISVLVHLLGVKPPPPVGRQTNIK